MFTAAGYEELGNNGTANFLYLAVGSGTTAITSTSTALASELDRVAVDSIVIADNVYTFEALFTPAQGVGTWSEWGIFTASVGGTMLLGANLSTTITKTNQEPRLATLQETGTY